MATKERGQNKSLLGPVGIRDTSERDHPGCISGKGCISWALRDGKGKAGKRIFIKC